MAGNRRPRATKGGAAGGKSRNRRTGLEGVPDEILLTIVKNLECAKDLSALGRSSKRLRRCVNSSGAWRDFVRLRFPGTTNPPKAGGHNYKALAESLTYQARCWDRKSTRFTVMYPAQQPRRRGPGQGFQTLVDVDYNMNSGKETLVWAAGEDIVARYRQKGRGRGQQTSVTWRQDMGSKRGLRAGTDDVSTINIVNLPHLKAPALLVGRVNGDLSLLSGQTDNSFGQQLANFSPTPSGGPVATERAQPLEQEDVDSVDILDDNNQSLVAACSNLGLSIYQLPQDTDTTTIHPITVYDESLTDDDQVRNAKWMGSRNLLALASRGTKNPLRYLSVTPSGFVLEGAAKNLGLQAEFSLRNTYVYAESLQPVYRHPGMTGPTPLLLSSWQDGTIRLQDIRTPSPFDTVYQDNVSPFSVYGPLLTYGADRFVAGDHSSSMIKIFDFRWPKPYHHTAALPCGTQYPFRFVEQRFTRPPTDTTEGRACCDHLRGLRCRWHELSRDIYYRPNTLYMLANSLPPSMRGSRVSSLAKASDVSPNFYLGITGAVVECTLGAIENPLDIDPHLGFPDFQGSKRPPPGGYLSQPLSATMMELGDGLRAVGNDANIVMPMVHSRTRGFGRDDERDRQLLRSVPAALRKKHRLDESFQRSADFSQDIGVDELVRQTQEMVLA